MIVDLIFLIAVIALFFGVIAAVKHYQVILVKIAFIIAFLITIVPLAQKKAAAAVPIKSLEGFAPIATANGQTSIAARIESNKLLDDWWEQDFEKAVGADTIRAEIIAMSAEVTKEEATLDKQWDRARFPQTYEKHSRAIVAKKNQLALMQHEWEDLTMRPRTEAVQPYKYIRG